MCGNWNQAGKAGRKPGSCGEGAPLLLPPPQLRGVACTLVCPLHFCPLLFWPTAGFLDLCFLSFFDLSVSASLSSVLCATFLCLEILYSSASSASSLLDFSLSVSQLRFPGRGCDWSASSFPAGHLWALCVSLDRYPWWKAALSGPVWQSCSLSPVTVCRGRVPCFWPTRRVPGTDWLQSFIFYKVLEQDIHCGIFFPLIVLALLLYYNICARVWFYIVPTALKITFKNTVLIVRGVWFLPSGVSPRIDVISQK